MFLNKAVLPARRPGIRDFLGQKKLFIQQPVNGGDMGSLYRFNPGNRSGGNDVMRMNQIILIQADQADAISNTYRSISRKRAQGSNSGSSWSK